VTAQAGGDATVLSVGGGPEQVAAIRTARRLGYRVVVADRNPAGPGMRMGDVAVPADISDAAAVVAVAAEHDVQAVVPAPLGRWLTTVGAVNDALGLRGISYDSALACTDKRVFHERCVAAGARRPAQASATDEDAILAAVAAVGRPCVVKPARGAGSNAVVVIEAGEDPVPAVGWHLANRGDGDDTLVEGLVEGTELGVDGAVVGGRLVVTLIRQKELTPPPFRQQLVSTAPAPIGPMATAAVTAELQLVVTALGLTDCLLNADVMLGSDGTATVLEAAGRPAGASLADMVIPAVTGVPFLAEGLRLALGEDASFEPRPLAAAVLRFFRLPAGRVVRVGQPPAAADSEDVLLFSCPLKPGQEIAPMAAVGDALERGLVITRGPDAAAARRLGELIEAGLDVEIETAPIGVTEGVGA